MQSNKNPNLTFTSVFEQGQNPIVQGHLYKEKMFQVMKKGEKYMFFVYIIFFNWAVTLLFGPKLNHDKKLVHPIMLP